MVHGWKSAVASGSCMEECAVASWEEECAGSMTRDSSQGRDQARDKCDKRAGK